MKRHETMNTYYCPIGQTKMFANVDFTSQFTKFIFLQIYHIYGMPGAVT